METNDLAALSYASQLLAFAALSVLFLARRAGSPFSGYLAVAAASSSLLGGVLTLQALEFIAFSTVIVIAEWTTKLFWVVALFSVLRALDSRRLAEKYTWRYVLPLLSVALAGLAYYSDSRFDSLAVLLVACGGVVMGVALISLAEQIYRNLPSDSTSSLRYVCVALVVISAYDIILFLRAISMQEIEADPWAARGFVHALAVLPLAMFGARGEFDPVADSPRQAVYYTFSLLTIGVGILLWLMAGEYVDGDNGRWRNVATIVFGAAAFSALGVFLVSATVRARVRVYLTKVFFKYKYDYRKEWLRFISTLSESGLENVASTAVRAVGQIVNSPGGIVWVQEEEGNAYVPIGSWRCEIPTMSPISSESELVQFLVKRQWVIDLEEMQRYPARYDGLEL
ncbi:MAG: hypothetical protein MUO51_11670, partial [Woeseiaceae bacterium]|nr:hypothetical protein [Woeseiaceae bacterium]